MMVFHDILKGLSNKYSNHIKSAIGNISMYYLYLHVADSFSIADEFFPFQCLLYKNIYLFHISYKTTPVDMLDQCIFDDRGFMCKNGSK